MTKKKNAGWRSVSNSTRLEAHMLGAEGSNIFSIVHLPLVDPLNSLQLFNPKESSLTHSHRITVHIH